MLPNISQSEISNQDIERKLEEINRKLDTEFSRVESNTKFHAYLSTASFIVIFSVLINGFITMLMIKKL